MRAIEASLLDGEGLYHEVVQRRLAQAKESVWIATANVKAMLIERDGKYRPIVDLFSDLERRRVELRLLHAELPSRPFRKFFDRKQRLVDGGLALKLCPRVHFKCVLIDNAWLYLGSANLTGAGLGAKGKDKRNFELGFVTEDFDTIDRVGAMFDSVWRGTPCRDCKLRRSCPDPIGPAAGKRSDVVLGRARRLPRAH